MLSVVHSVLFQYFHPMIAQKIVILRNLIDNALEIIYRIEKFVSATNPSIKTLFGFGFKS